MCCFEIRPAGRGAPRIDPKPILDGWKLLESTAIYRAAGRNPLLGKSPAIGQVMLMSKAQLQRRVLANPRIDVYDCGRHDIRSGIVDRRVLATLEFLAASGLKPTVSSLRCGHSYRTKGGSVCAPQLRRRCRHRAGSTGCRSSATRARVGRRHGRPPAADASGRDEAGPDHHA